jgi:hypothetical protein
VPTYTIRATNPIPAAVLSDLRKAGRVVVRNDLDNGKVQAKCLSCGLSWQGHPASVDLQELIHHCQEATQ